jgi:hypothetical protein
LLDKRVLSRKRIAAVEAIATIKEPTSTHS